jgi:hypothetical protein
MFMNSLLNRRPRRRLSQFIVSCEFPGDLTVEDAFARFKREAPNCIVTMYMYIVDDEGHLKGVIDMALAQNLR